MTSGYALSVVTIAVPNLATSWKARVGASLVGLAIGLAVAVITGNLGLSGIVLGGFAILINVVRYRQERMVRSQASPVSDSD